MTLYTKCIFAPATPSDGTRVSVMSRHTLSDGVTPNPQITEKTYSEWKRELAPPLELLMSYHQTPLGFREFQDRYLSYIRTPEMSGLVKILAERALTEDITLLCSEAAPEICHRRLLAEECKRYQPKLRIEHK